MNFVFTMFIIRTLRRQLNTCSKRLLSNQVKQDSSSSTQNSDESKTTHFGFQTVTEEEKASKVYGVFESVANKYDLMNDAMSMGIHRLWKDHFMMRLAPFEGCQLLDVAGGTGDIAFRFLDYIKNLDKLKSSQKLYSKAMERKTKTYRENQKMQTSQQHHVVVCDINQSMLEAGQQRAAASRITEGLSWLQGDAMNLPVKDESFDAYTIAFGIRNVVDVNKALSEAYRVLKPGGRFMCLEFSHVPNPGLRWIYDMYSFQVIPVMGKVIANDWESYQYLVESIRKFPNQEKFAKMIRNAGFRWPTYENLTFGVVAIHSGFKL